MSVYDLSEHKEKIFFKSPPKSVLWFEGEVPNNVQGVPGMNGDDYVVPFKANNYAFNSGAFSFEDSFLDSSEFFKKIGQFTWYRDLDIKVHQPIELFLTEPPNSRFQETDFITIPKSRICMVNLKFFN